MADTHQTSTAKRRGRKPGAKVPCDRCIARASRLGSNISAIGLCESCKNSLRQNRIRSNPSSKQRLQAHNQSASNIDPIDANLPLAPCGEAEHEQREIRFFMKHSRQQFASRLGSPFWQTRVVQAARKDLAVRHAIVAVGASHELLLAGPGSESLPEWLTSRFALEQYNKAIHCLVEHNDTAADLTLLLTTCILFACCEGLRGNCQQAMIHTTQGFGILQQLTEKRDGPGINEYAVELYELYLRIRSSQLRCRGMTESSWDTIDVPLDGLQPARWEIGVASAKGRLLLILDQCAAFLLSLEIEASHCNLARTRSQIPSHLIRQLKDWDAECGGTLDRKASPDSAMETEQKLVLALQTHRILANIMVRVDLANGPQCWSVFREDFNSIVEHAEGLLGPSRERGRLNLSPEEHTDSGDTSSPLEPHLDGLDVTRPLFEVCARCSDAGVKRKALNLLANHPQPAWMRSSTVTEGIGRSFLQSSKDSALVFGASSHVQQIDILERRRSSAPQTMPTGGGTRMEEHDSTATMVDICHNLTPGLVNRNSASRKLPTAQVVDG